MRRRLDMGTIGGRRSVASAALVGLLVAAAGFEPATADPAASPDTLRLSLRDCVERAITVGEEMALADADYAAAIGIYRQARSDVFPHLNLSSSYTRTFASVFRQEGNFDFKPFTPDTLASIEQRLRDLERALPTAPLAGLSGLFQAGPFASVNSWDVSLGVTQKLFEGGSIWSAVQVARHALTSFDRRRDDRRNDVTMLVREAYLGALLADRAAQIAELGLQLAETQLQRVRLRQEAGQSAEFDLLQAEVQRDNQLPVVKEAHNRRAVAYLQLCGIANLPVDTPLVLTTPLLDPLPLPEGPMAGIDTTGIFASALAGPHIVALDEEMLARRDALGVAGKDAWPALSLFGNYAERAYPGDVWPGRGDWLRDANAGVRLDWALFDGFRTQGAKQESRAQIATAQQNLQQGRENIQLVVARDLGELERAAADMRSRTRTVQVAKRALELANLRFEEGASSLLEVEDARVAYQVAQGSEATARHDYAAALARLERYSGRPLFTSWMQQLGHD